MTPRAKTYLDDMLDRAQYLVQLAAERSLDEMEEDRLIRSSVERELMVLGAALYLLHNEAPEIAEQINQWREVIAMRHKLVHGYATVAPAIMRDVIASDLPLLIQQLTNMIAEHERDE